MWVTNRFDGTISRIDPDTNEVVKEIPVGLDPRGIAIGFDSVWVALAGSNQVVRIDPETNDVTQPIGVGNAPGSLAVSADAVWVANTLDDTVIGDRPRHEHGRGHDRGRGRPLGRSRSCRGPCGWRTNGTARSRGSSPVRRRPVRSVIGSVPQGLAGVNGDLWVSVRGTATSHRGGTLRLVAGDPPNSLDPGNSYDSVAWQVLHLIADGLVAFEPIGGDPRLVPDLATAIPTPTDGGLTYTFQLRPGIRYSNGEVVAPADFLRAFERGWPLDPSDHTGPLRSGSSGPKRAGSDPGTCDLSEGIVTDDASGTITFHLSRPRPRIRLQAHDPVRVPGPALRPG